MRVAEQRDSFELRHYRGLCLFALAHKLMYTCYVAAARRAPTPSHRSSASPSSRIDRLTMIKFNLPRHTLKRVRASGQDEHLLHRFWNRTSIRTRQVRWLQGHSVGRP